MFTGLIEEIGTIAGVTAASRKLYFDIQCSLIAKSVKIGDSIACNGICMTATRVTDLTITTEAMQETCAKTTASLWKKGDKLNLERALLANSRLDGHLVQGHIDTIVKVAKIAKEAENILIFMELPAKYTTNIVPQGSIAVNGISLTVARITGNSFAVGIISHTLKNTNLNDLLIGQPVNIEFDIIGKYIIRQFENSSKANFRYSEKWLIENGF